MSINAQAATFERIELLWKPALRTQERVDRNTIPIGWHCYELYANYVCDYGRPTLLMEYVPDEHFVGTILIPELVPFHRKRNFRCVYGSVVGFDTYYTVKRFCEKIGLGTPLFEPPDLSQSTNITCAQ